MDKKLKKLEFDDAVKLIEDTKDVGVCVDRGWDGETYVVTIIRDRRRERVLGEITVDILKLLKDKKQFGSKLEVVDGTCPYCWNKETCCCWDDKPRTDKQIMTDEDKIKKWVNDNTYSSSTDIMLLEKLNEKGLSKSQIVGMLEILENICRHCWDNAFGCQCWNDE